jgi:predicted RNase H-like nuclease (RuvC/YqgF family)
MTKKEDLQQELLEKVKLGTKPSDIKKLKRSKSADDITTIPNPPPPPNNNPPTHLLQDQLNQKQKLVEDLRKQLETKNTELTQTKQSLDNSLFARIEAVKQFGQVYDKLQQVKKELDETIEEASTEITSSDDKVSQLRTKLRTASQQITSLQQELK